jgi:hypothetical protein
MIFPKEALNKSTFDGEPAQRCEAGQSKIKDLAQLIWLKKCPVLLNQRLSRKPQSMFS